MVIVVLFGFGSRSREPSKRWGAGSRVQTRGANLRLRLGSPLAITGARLRIQLSRHRRLLVADEHSLALLTFMWIDLAWI
ncbi:hypothetical protein FEAC_26290 [Ferrimicrobium acidiphilum DSM 19497]|uniref:Uncharacterized protein n=1 Tax=Ferrimicrobium acidiphilum DSM 19497 TaxID=1121877 RepID=A0A0D8FR30_9ACTN|nr:hypothetical protein FEAC_26290 [Ferrimicrobium acidiphilum DSM 19497]